MPACAWKVSGGSLAWSRDCSRSLAAEPAAPAVLVAPGVASLSLSLPLHAASSRLTAAAPATRPVYLLCMRMSVLRLHRRDPGRCRLRGVGARSHPSQPPTSIQPLRSVGVKTVSYTHLTLPT